MSHPPNGFASLDDFRKSARFSTVFLPGLGKNVRIRDMDADQMLDWSKYTASNMTQQANLRAAHLLVTYCVCDGDGELMFKPGDLQFLKGLTPDDAQKLAAACQEHCGLTVEENEDDDLKN